MQEFLSILEFYSFLKKFENFVQIKQSLDFDSH